VGHLQVTQPDQSNATKKETKVITNTATLTGVKRVLLARLALGAALLTLLAAVVPASASARVGQCWSGLVNYHMAWANCNVGSIGWQGYALTVQCYYWGANTAYGFPGGPTYATCPAWSHVTRIIVTPTG
jgi:hypothetical protein